MILVCLRWITILPPISPRLNSRDGIHFTGDGKRSKIVQFHFLFVHEKIQWDPLLLSLSGLNPQASPFRCYNVASRPRQTLECARHHSRSRWYMNDVIVAHLKTDLRIIAPTVIAPLAILNI